MIRKLAALARGALSDPYTLCTLGSLLLLRGLDAIAEQARALAEQVAQVQKQWAYAVATGPSPPVPAEAQANGARGARPRHAFTPESAQGGPGTFIDSSGISRHKCDDPACGTPAAACDWRTAWMPADWVPTEGS